MSFFDYQWLTAYQSVDGSIKPTFLFSNKTKPGDWALASWKQSALLASDWSTWRSHIERQMPIKTLAYVNEEGYLIRNNGVYGSGIWKDQDVLLSNLHGFQANEAWFWTDSFSYLIESLPKAEQWTTYAGKKLTILTMNQKPYVSTDYLIQYQTSSAHQDAHHIRILFRDFPKEDLIIEFFYAKEPTADAKNNQKEIPRWIGYSKEPNGAYMAMRSITLQPFILASSHQAIRDEQWKMERSNEFAGYTYQHDTLRAMNDSRSVQFQKIQLKHTYETIDAISQQKIQKEIVSGPMYFPAMHPSVLREDEKEHQGNGWLIGSSVLGTQWKTWWKRYIDQTKTLDLEAAINGTTSIETISLSNDQKTSSVIENNGLLIQGLKEQTAWNLSSETPYVIKDEGTTANIGLSIKSIRPRFYVPYEVIYEGNITKQQPIDVSYVIQKIMWGCETPIRHLPKSTTVSAISGSKKLSFQKNKWSKKDQSSGWHSSIVSLDQTSKHQLYQWQGMLEQGSAPIGFCVDVLSNQEMIVVFAERDQFLFLNNKETRYAFSSVGIEKINYDSTGANGAISNKTTFLNAGFGNSKWRMYLAKKSSTAIGGWSFDELSRSATGVKGLLNKQLFRVTIERIGTRIAIYHQPLAATKGNDLLGTMVFAKSNLEQPKSHLIGTLGLDQSMFTIENMYHMNAFYRLVRSKTQKHQTSILKKHLLTIDGKTAFDYQSHFLSEWKSEEKKWFTTRSFNNPTVVVLSDNLSSQLVWTTTFLPDPKQPKRVEIVIEKPTTLPLGPVKWHSNDFDQNLKGTVYFEANEKGYLDPIFTPKIEIGNLPKTIPANLKQLKWKSIRVLDERIAFDVSESGKVVLTKFDVEPDIIDGFENQVLIANQQISENQGVVRLVEDLLHQKIESNALPSDIEMNRLVFEIKTNETSGVNVQFVHQKNNQWLSNQIQMHDFSIPKSNAKQRLTGFDWSSRCTTIGHNMMKTKWKKSKTNGIAMVDNQRMFSGFMDVDSLSEYQATYAFTPYSNATHGLDDDPIGFVIHGESEDDFYVFMIEGKEMIADSMAKKFPAFRMSNRWGEDNAISFDTAKGVDFDPYTLIADQHRNVSNGKKTTLTKYYTQQCGWRTRHMRLFRVTNGIFKAYKPSLEWFTYYDGWKLNQKNTVMVKCFEDQIVIDLNGKRIYFAKLAHKKGKIGFVSFSQLVELHELTIENLKRETKIPKIAVDAWTFYQKKKAYPMLAVQSFPNENGFEWTKEQYAKKEQWHVQMQPMITEIKRDLLLHWDATETIELPSDINHQAIKNQWSLIKQNGLFFRYEINQETTNAKLQQAVRSQDAVWIGSHQIQVSTPLISFDPSYDFQPVVDRKTNKGWQRLTIEEVYALSGLIKVRETIDASDEIRVQAASLPALIYEGMLIQNERISFPGNPRHPFVFAHSEKNGFMEIPKAEEWTDGIHTSPVIGLIQTPVYLYVLPYEIGTYQNGLWVSLVTLHAHSVIRHTTNERLFDSLDPLYQPSYLKLATCQYHLPNQQIETRIESSQASAFRPDAEIPADVKKHLWDMDSAKEPFVIEQGVSVIEIPQTIWNEQKNIAQDTVDKHRAGGQVIVLLPKSEEGIWTQAEIEASLGTNEYEIAQVEE